ncbi:hypothetical protein CC78DRAFT_602932 [Lojkania enalia]|uniref:Uncharacterized protein n=1 Tax=Lojkania enalia TaxID=147567 RepID=A0A9P4K8C4_9PLEO|nr:hypothetical protein CC78DRAFT_602932 [Didymosphaeria enalia]
MNLLLFIYDIRAVTGYIVPSLSPHRKEIDTISVIVEPPFKALNRAPIPRIASFTLGLIPLPSSIGPALLVRRGAIDLEKLWNEKVCKGNQLLELMKANDADAGKMLGKDSAQSPYVDFGLFKKWGYEFLDYEPYYTFEGNFPMPLVSAFKGLGVEPKKATDSGGFECWMWVHETEREVNDVKYPPTHANYITLFDAAAGLLVGQAKYSPKYMGAKQDPPVSIYPALKTWADIAFLQWQELHSQINSGANIGNVKYIFSSPVENDECVRLIDETLKKSGNERKKWPGVTFDADSDEAKALIGCPNGIGPSYFLATHKKQLGSKIVEKVTVFMDDGKAKKFPSLLYWVADF